MPTQEFARVKVQLVAPDSTELWVDLMPYVRTLGLTGFRGRIIVTDKTGSWSCRVGIQSYVAAPETPNTALSPAVGAGLSAITTVSRTVFNFDPSHADNGNTDDNKHGCRLGLLYKSTSGVARAEVIFEVAVRRG